jgi:hypothetical protein
MLDVMNGFEINPDADAVASGEGKQTIRRVECLM